MTADELSLKLQELEEERWKLRFRSGTQKIDNPLRLRILRRDIARIKTALRQSELGKQKIAK